MIIWEYAFYGILHFSKKVVYTFFRAKTEEILIYHALHVIFRFEIYLSFRKIIPDKKTKIETLVFSGFPLKTCGNDALVYVWQQFKTTVVFTCVFAICNVISISRLVIPALLLMPVNLKKPEAFKKARKVVVRMQRESRKTAKRYNLLFQDFSCQELFFEMSEKV